MNMPVKELLAQTIDKFNQKSDSDPKLHKELEGIEKRVNVDLESEKYNFRLTQCHAVDFKDGLLPEADITILSDPQTVEDLINGKMKVMKAWATKKLKVKGSLEDVMRLRKLF
jgi:putative sterol carrier protein